MSGYDLMRKLRQRQYYNKWEENAAPNNYANYEPSNDPHGLQMQKYIEHYNEFEKKQQNNYYARMTEARKPKSEVPLTPLTNNTRAKKQLNAITKAKQQLDKSLERSKTEGFNFPVKIKKGGDKYKKGFFSPKITETNAGGDKIFSEFTSKEKIEEDYYGKVVSYKDDKVIVETCNQGSKEPYKMVNRDAIQIPFGTEIDAFKKKCPKSQPSVASLPPVIGGTRRRKHSKRTKKQRKHRK